AAVNPFSGVSYDGFNSVGRRCEAGIVTFGNEGLPAFSCSEKRIACPSINDSENRRRRKRNSTSEEPVLTSKAAHRLTRAVGAVDELSDFFAAPGRLRSEHEPTDLRRRESGMLHRRLVPLEAPRAFLANHRSAGVAKSFHVLDPV